MTYTEAHRQLDELISAIRRAEFAYGARVQNERIKRSLKEYWAIREFYEDHEEDRLP